MVVQIALHNAGRRFGRGWVLKHLQATLTSQTPTAITGPNGSGKSTLLKMLSGFLMPDEGMLKWSVNDVELPEEEVYRHIALAAPYLELPETLSPLELLPIIFKLVPRIDGMTPKDFMEFTGLEVPTDRVLSAYSSGMKQRFKLALAFTADTHILLLDEPLSHLDAQGVLWYKEKLPLISQNRLLVVASNENPDEIFLCINTIQMGRKITSVKSI